MSKKIKKYTRYTEEFKRDAVRLVEQEGLSAAQVARDLGVNVNSIHGWLRKHREDAGDELSDDERLELARLRRENRILREEREILKKAAAFFASESK